MKSFDCAIVLVACVTGAALGGGAVVAAQDSGHDSDDHGARYKQAAVYDIADDGNILVVFAVSEGASFDAENIAFMVVPAAAADKHALEEAEETADAGETFDRAYIKLYYLMVQLSNFHSPSCSAKLYSFLLCATETTSRSHDAAWRRRLRLFNANSRTGRAQAGDDAPAQARSAVRDTHRRCDMWPILPAVVY